MKRNLVAVLVATIGVLPGHAWAQKDKAVELAAGIREIEEGDFESAVGTLERAVQQLGREKGREKELARAHVYLGMAHLGLDHTDEAKAQMRAAWMSHKDLKLDDKEFSPRVRQLYALAKSEAKDETKNPEGASKPAKENAATPAPKATVAAGPSPRPSAPILGIGLGTRVRVSAPATSNKPLVGTVTSFDDTSVTIKRDDARDTLNVPVTAGSRFEVSASRSSKGKRALLWGLAGALVAGGAGAGYGNGNTTVTDAGCASFYSGRYGYVPEFCSSQEKRGAGKWTGIGAGSGALIGAVIGSATGGGEIWKPAEKVRVGVLLRGRSVQVALRF